MKALAILIGMVGYVSAVKVMAILKMLKVDVTNWEQKDFEELKSFVMNAYTATVKGIQILSQPDYDFIARYDYKSISKEVEQLLLQ